MHFFSPSIIKRYIFLLLRSVEVSLLRSFGANNVGDRERTWIVSIDPSIVFLGFVVLLLLLRTPTCLFGLVLVVILRQRVHGQVDFKLCENLKTKLSVAMRNQQKRRATAGRDEILQFDHGLTNRKLHF